MVYAPRVEFDAEKHVYTVNGEVVPNVTQIVAPLGEDYDEPDDLTEGIIDAATERGTVMHGYIAHRLTGGEPADYEMPDMYAPWADAVEMFLDEHEIEPILIETPMAKESGQAIYDTYTYAGTPDLICHMDGTLALLDWKFVSKIQKSKVGAQLAAYSMLCNAAGIFPERLIAVQFTRGSYRLYPVADIIEAEQAFRMCYDVMKLKDAEHTRGKIF